MSAALAADHPTTNLHHPLTPWACEVGGEGVLGDDPIDFHIDCRRCVLIAGSVAVNEGAEVAGRYTSGEVIEHAAWYEQARHRHSLPAIHAVSGDGTNQETADEN